MSINFPNPVNAVNPSEFDQSKKKQASQAASHVQQPQKPQQVGDTNSGPAPYLSDSHLSALLQYYGMNQNGQYNLPPGSPQIPSGFQPGMNPQTMWDVFNNSNYSKTDPQGNFAGLKPQGASMLAGQPGINAWNAQQQNFWNTFPFGGVSNGPEASPGQSVAGNMAGLGSGSSSGGGDAGGGGGGGSG